jgi:choline-glycine betaine transporter
MTFATGVSVGLFSYGASEPLWHQTSNFFAQQGYHSQDETDAFAIGMTITHWGFTGWAEYLIIALGMALAQWRFDLPASCRSIFYPIIGNYTFGWMGDMIDVSTMLVTIAGICTSLGLGVIQLISGFQYVGWLSENNSFDRIVSIQNAIIWWLTIFAAMSVSSGVLIGVRTLSNIIVILTVLLAMFAFCTDDSKFLLNMIVQQTGECGVH